jgi:hypothetical protein
MKPQDCTRLTRDEIKELSEIGNTLRSLRSQRLKYNK